MSKTALINYEEQLALAAGQYAEAEQSSATGDFFGLKGGNIAWGGNPIKGNKIGVIIVDAVFENVFYKGVVVSSFSEAVPDHSVTLQRR